MKDSHALPVILAYHSISEGRSPLCTEPEMFAKQMDWLAVNRYPVIPLAELVETLRVGRSLPRRTVVLTFDDGFKDFYDQAFPILRRFSFPSTVFLVTGFCGGTNRWPGQAAWVEDFPLLDWQQVKELAREGVEFGAHSRTHPDLARASLEDVEREVLASKEEVDEQVGHPADFFCYPYGRYTPGARAIVAKYFRGACSSDLGRVLPGSDLYSLPRIDTFYLRSAAIFRWLFAPAGSLYLSFRRYLRLLRASYEAAFPTR